MKPFSLSTIIIFALVAMISCTGNDDKSGNALQRGGQVNARPALASSGATVPSFAAYDLDGKLRQSSEWVGQRPVIINFWGTWCPPCRREIPDLVELYKEFQDEGVEIVSLAVKDSPDKVREYADKAGMKWTLLMSADQIMIDYKALTGVPTTVFVNRNGEEVVRFVGMRDYNTLKMAFEAIL